MALERTAVAFCRNARTAHCSARIYGPFISPSKVSWSIPTSRAWVGLWRRSQFERASISHCLHFLTQFLSVHNINALLQNNLHCEYPVSQTKYWPNVTSRDNKWSTTAHRPYTPILRSLVGDAGYNMIRPYYTLLALQTTFQFVLNHTFVYNNFWHFLYAAFLTCSRVNRISYSLDYLIRCP